MLSIRVGYAYNLRPTSAPVDHLIRQTRERLDPGRPGRPRMREIRHARQAQRPRRVGIRGSSL